MNSLTLSQLDAAIKSIGLVKMAPDGLMDLMIARSYMLGEHKHEPKVDPRVVMDRMGLKR